MQVCNSQCTWEEELTFKACTNACLEVTINDLPLQIKMKVCNLGVISLSETMLHSKMLSDI